MSPPGTAPYGLIGVSLGSPVQTRSPLRAVTSTGSQLGQRDLGVGDRHRAPLLTEPRGPAVRPGDQRQGGQSGGRRRHPGLVHRGHRRDRHRRRSTPAIGDYLYILIVINIFFGVFNLFPMLPLDGGHVAIAVYEKIRTGRRKVMYHADVAKLMPFTWVFMLFLAVLIVPAFLTDILHPMANPFG